MGATAEKSSPATFVFVSLKGNRHTRTLNYYHGLQKLGLNPYWFEIDSRQKVSGVRAICNQFSSRGVHFVVASPSHILVPYLRLRTKRKIFLDAGWPLYDGVIQSRRMYGILGWRLVFTFALDFVSFHLSTKVLLETSEQTKSVGRKYLLSKKKLVVLATGFDEDRFQSSDVGNAKKPMDGSPFVLFRGGPQDEAGLDVLFKALEQLKNKNQINFIVVSKVKKPLNLDSNRLTILNDYLSDVDLWDLYQNARIVLGQLSNHPRLDKTLPHKFFEAAFFSKPYLTSNRGIIGKYASGNDVISFQAGNAKELAAKIDEIWGSDTQLGFFGHAISNLYRKEFSQEVLTKKFLEILS